MSNRGSRAVHDVQGVVNVDVIAVRGEREVHDVLRVLAHGAGAVMADVPAARGRVDERDVAPADVAAEDRVIGDGPADGAHVGVLAVEEALHVLLEEALDLVDDLRALVIALPGVTFRVPMREVRSHDPPDPAAGHVFTGNQVDAAFTPFVLVLHQGLDMGHVPLVHRQSFLMLEAPLAREDHGDIRLVARLD